MTVATNWTKCSASFGERAENLVAAASKARSKLARTKSQKPADLFVVNFVCALRGDQFGLDLL
jgi:hypothetical protein